MIGRFLDAGHRVDWVTGDEVYGGNPRLRTALEERGVGFVLAVASSADVITGAGRFRADALAAKVPKRAWQKLSAGVGAKGHRFYDWAVIDLADSGPIHHHQLLIRRNRTTGERAYYRCFSPVPEPLATLVRVAGLRWRAFLAVIRAAEHARHPAPDGLIPLTCNEIQRLFTALVGPTPEAVHRLRWSLWRRRHQARSRTSHYHRQAADRTSRSRSTAGVLTRLASATFGG